MIQSLIFGIQCCVTGGTTIFCELFSSTVLSTDQTIEEDQFNQQERYKPTQWSFKTLEDINWK